METYASPGLEFDDVLEIAKTYRDKYSPQKWWVDQAMPAYIKSFNKNGMRCPEFTKDVLGGIAAVRSKIVNSSGRRSLKIIQNESNKKTISALSKHRFQLDGQGNLTQNPADEPGIADIADNIRYIGQNMWAVKGTQKAMVEYTDDPGKAGQPPSLNYSVNEQMRNEIAKRISGGSTVITSTTKKKGGFTFTC
jgi:hypothetical protein